MSIVVIFAERRNSSNLVWQIWINVDIYSWNSAYISQAWRIYISLEAYQSNFDAYRSNLTHLKIYQEHLTKLLSLFKGEGCPIRIIFHYLKGKRLEIEDKSSWFWSVDDMNKFLSSNFFHLSLNSHKQIVIDHLSCK